jgi:hypothetical protein
LPHAENLKFHTAAQPTTSILLPATVEDLASGVRLWFFFVGAQHAAADARQTYLATCTQFTSRERAHPVEAQGFSPAKIRRREALSIAPLFSQHVFDSSISH